MPLLPPSECFSATSTKRSGRRQQKRGQTRRRPNSRDKAIAFGVGAAALDQPAAAAGFSAVIVNNQTVPFLCKSRIAAGS